MKIILAILFPFIVMMYIVIYALCRAASFDDRERERMAREWDEEKYKEKIGVDD